MLSKALKHRLDAIGLKIVRGKEAIDRNDEAGARTSLGDALGKLMALTRDMKEGAFDKLSEDDFDDLSQTVEAMALDLKTLLQRLAQAPPQTNGSHTIVDGHGSLN